MKRLSASSVPLAMKCHASHALPQVNTTNGASKRGTYLHQYIADALTIGHKRALERLPEEYREECSEGFDLDVLRGISPNAEIKPELAIGWNLDTDQGRIIGSMLDRHYDAQEGELCGTADLFIRQGDRLSIIDWKSGVSYDWWQLQTLAVLAYKATGVSDITMTIVRLGEKPMHRDCDLLDLDGWAEEIKHVAAQIINAFIQIQAGQAPNVSAGEWCQYCPALRACPRTALVRYVSTDLEPYKDTQGLTLDQVGKAWAFIQNAKQAIAVIEEDIKAIAKQELIPLPDGKVLKMVEQQRQYLDGAITEKVLRESFGPEIAAKVCKPSATFTELNKTLKKDAERAIDMIRAAGGVEIKTSMTAKELKR
jgi:hypothetical protein